MSAVEHDDGWYQRMAERSASIRGREAQAADERWRIESRREHQRELWRIANDMTVNEMQEHRAWLQENTWYACACPGPPNCCRDVWEVEDAINHELGRVAGVLRDASARQSD